ncbi:MULTISPECIES: hypothetical protein [Rhizobium]|uniref:Uncharacterized protein n=1 Tax=Rhizobium lusitanum TaxID=293958 RepID=A0A1C3XGX9_9HYPH|nr:hypothetical protein [Rhizobium tropici]SCB51532.1 hypothetical protein GA0061101_14034 [Rhizobium lusitanum]
MHSPEAQKWRYEQMKANLAISGMEVDPELEAMTEAWEANGQGPDCACCTLPTDLFGEDQDQGHLLGTAFFFVR